STRAQTRHESCSEMEPVPKYPGRPAASLAVSAETEVATQRHVHSQSPVLPAATRLLSTSPHSRSVSYSYPQQFGLAELAEISVRMPRCSSPSPIWTPAATPPSPLIECTLESEGDTIATLTIGEPTTVTPAVSASRRNFADRELDVKRVSAPLFDVSQQMINYSHSALKFNPDGYPIIPNLGSFRLGRDSSRGRHGSTLSEHDICNFDYQGIYQQYRCICAFIKFLNIHKHNLDDCRTQLEVQDQFLVWSNPEQKGRRSTDTGSGIGQASRSSPTQPGRPCKIAGGPGKRTSITRFLYPSPTHASAKAWTRLRAVGLCIEHFIEEQSPDVSSAINVLKDIQSRLTARATRSAQVIYLQDQLACLLIGLRERHNKRYYGQDPGESFEQFLSRSIAKISKRLDESHERFLTKSRLNYHKKRGRIMRGIADEGEGGQEQDLTPEDGAQVPVYELLPASSA
ncbi:hypothetical protein EV182_002179, partial [Spiromyces aspiralis]